MSAITTAVQIAKTIQQMRDGFDYLQKKAVYVGIPKETNKEHPKKEGESGPPVTNVELMFIHEYGAPSRNIPPRPVLHLTVKDKTLTDHVQELMKDATVAALQGDYGQVDASMQGIGMQAVNVARNIFGSDKLAPNAPYTIAKKGSSAPLIDLGELKKSITYVVREE